MIRYDKKNIDLSKEARKNGVNAMTAHCRLRRGWGLKEAITKPSDGTSLPPEKRQFKTKEEGQWMLDDLPYDKLPKTIQSALPPTTKRLKFGKMIRRNNNTVFLKWYEEEFKTS